MAEIADKCKRRKKSPPSTENETPAVGDAQVGEIPGNIRAFEMQGNLQRHWLGDV